MWNTLKKQFESTDSLVSLALGLAVVLVIGMTLVNYIRNRTQKAASTTRIEESAKPGESTFPVKHVVKAGETLWSIAETYYKSGYNWVDIQKANTLSSANVINVDQTLIIPVVTPIMPKGEVSSTATQVAPKDKSYTVAHGDDLWSIAIKEYGDGYRWVDIAKNNNLTNPNIIHSGNVLNLP